jgi:hypothetical protein
VSINIKNRKHVPYFLSFSSCSIIARELQNVSENDGGKKQEKMAILSQK